MKLALWVVRRHRPFAIVEDPELLDIFSDLNKSAVTPSQSTISRDVKEIFRMSHTNVSRILQVSTPLCNNLPANNTLRHILASYTFVLTDGLHHK
jgi:arginine repressor